MVDYMRKRATGKSEFFSEYAWSDRNYCKDFTRHLFDWVIENLLKNALDAMEGKGT